jgi:hypothetical protein
MFAPAYSGFPVELTALIVQISLTAPADFIPQPRPLVLDGCPMFAPAYMGRKRIFQMLSLHAQAFLLLAVVF